jgi:xanthine dehydrogenase accessory factor
MSMREADALRAAAAALHALRGGEAVAAVVAIDGDPPSVIGRRMLVWEARTEGTLGPPDLDAAAIEAGREVLRAAAAPGIVEARHGGGSTTLFIEAHVPRPELVIVGAGHIAQPLCSIGARLGFAVTVLDDRPAFATRERFPEADRVLAADFSDPFREVAIRTTTHLVLVTRGHKYDFDALRTVLQGDVRPAYIGMVGSQRRVRATLLELSAEGIEADRLSTVHAPIGLDIGAETPAEIAVAISAEIVRVRRGGTGQPLRERARVFERWIARPAEPPGADPTG